MHGIRIRPRELLLATFGLFALFMLIHPPSRGVLRFGCDTNFEYAQLEVIEVPGLAGESKVDIPDIDKATTGGAYQWVCGENAGVNYHKSNDTYVVGLTAIANPGYKFDHWSGGCSGTDPTIEVTLHCGAADTYCTANYVAVAGDMGNVDLASSDLASNGLSHDMAKMCDGPCPPPLPLTSHTSHESKTLHGVAFDAYIAVGDQGALTTSADGLTWTAGSFGAQASNDYNSVAASATATNHYVAAITGGGVVYSPDAVTWTAATASAGSTPPTKAYDVVWGNSQYVTAGQGGEFCTSPDGATWTLHQQGSGFTNFYPTRVVWTGTQYVVVGGLNSGPFVATSPDGATWTAQSQVTSATSQFLNAVGWGSSLLVAVGNGAAAVNADIITSPDGVTWTKASAPSSGAAMSLSAVAWTGTWWAAFGASGASLISSDGMAWSAGAQITNASFAGAIGATGPRGLVVVGATGTILTAEK